MDLGGNRIRTFLNVTLPAIRISLIASALLCFTVSFDEVAVTFFVTGFGRRFRSTSGRCCGSASRQR